MKLFGLAGTAGSGKDTVAELICEMFNAHNYSTSDFVRACTRFVFDYPPDHNPIRDELFIVATQLRELNQSTTVQFGVLQAQHRDFRRQLISGLRSVGEAKAVRRAGGLIIGVDADPKIRFERIVSRSRDRESQRKFEDFLRQDEYENKGVAGGDMRGIRHIINDADILIINDGTLEDLRQQIKDKIQPLIKKD